MITTATATAPAPVPGRANEDWVGTGPGYVVLLDGVTARGETGCRHDVPWYVRQLGAALVDRVAGHETLPDVLASAIRTVAGQHAATCDLSAPGTPAAAVGILRTRHDRTEWLVLADVTVVLDHGHGLDLITDDRVRQSETVATASASVGSAAHRAAVGRMMLDQLTQRNSDSAGGYWVAAADPAAATRALTGVRTGIGRAAVMSDGAAAVVDTYGLMTWQDAMDLMETAGPGEILRKVRTAELADPDGVRWPRLTTSDDATAALITTRMVDGGSARRDHDPLTVG